MSKPMMGSLKSKKVKKNKGKKVIRNVLTLKPDTYWPLVSEEEADKIRNILEKHLSIVKCCKPKVPWHILMKMTREQRQVKTEEEKESLPFEEKQKILDSNRSRKHLTIGLNMTVRHMEQGKILFLLVDSLEPPDILVGKILLLAREKRIPIGLMPNLKQILKSIIDFPTIVLGFKKTLLEDSCPIRGCLEIKTVLDKFIVTSSNKSLTGDSNETLSRKVVQVRLPDILLFRSSDRERVFKPNLTISSTTMANYIEVNASSKTSSFTRKTFKRYTDQESSDLIPDKTFESPLVLSVQSNSIQNRNR